MKANWRYRNTGQRFAKIRIEHRVTAWEILGAIYSLAEKNYNTSEYTIDREKITADRIIEHIRFQLEETGSVWSSYNICDDYGITVNGDGSFNDVDPAILEHAKKLFPDFFAHLSN